MASVSILLFVRGIAVAGGPFGPPEPIAKPGGGLHTAFGYWYQQDTYKNGTEYAIRQNQIYSEAGYGFGNRWEVHARIGLSDLKVMDAYRSTSASTVAFRNDFAENWKFFTAVGAKGFYPINGVFGIGSFIHGTYYFSDFTDKVSGTQTGAPYSVDVGVKGLWDVNFGVGLQATVPYGVKMYIGPYIYYSEARIASSATIAGLAVTAGEATIRNKNVLGGFAGVEVPLPKGFRLNLEGQYSERLSAGVAVAYTY